MNLLRPPPHHVCYNKFRIINGCVGRRKSSLEGEIAARDRVIDFGKYKGKMLGSLPSRYLKWASKNLRAGDSEEWAKLADQVLGDPIYRDRMEWEFALNVLNGNSCSSRRPTSTSAVSELHEISETFGWDNLDRVGWAKVDFDLLGTSNGGKIPRLSNIDNHTQLNKLNHPLPPPPPPVSRRMERRERQKMRLRSTQTQENNNTTVNDEDDKALPGQNNGIANPFPGRKALLQKAINHHSQFNWSPKH